MSAVLVLAAIIWHWIS